MSENEDLNRILNEYGTRLGYVGPLRVASDKAGDAKDVAASVALEILASGRRMVIFEARVGSYRMRKVVSPTEIGPLSQSLRVWFPLPIVDLFDALFTAIKTKKGT